jgi:hypothetical protein
LPFWGYMQCQETFLVVMVERVVVDSLGKQWIESRDTETPYNAPDSPPITKNYLVHVRNHGSTKEMVSRLMADFLTLAMHAKSSGMTLSKAGRQKLSAK